MLAVFVVPFGVFGLGILFFDLLQPPGSGPIAWIEARQLSMAVPGTEELSARIAWFALAMAFLLVEFAATALALGVLWRTSPSRCRVPMVAAFALLTVLYVGFLLVSHSQEHGLSKGVFRFTWERVEGNAHFPGEFAAAVKGIIATLNLMAVVAIAACWVAIASLVGPSDARGADARVEELAERIRRGRLMLFVSSALLVVGVLHMSMWLRWGLGIVGAPGTSGEGERLVSMITGFWGLVFSAAAIGIVVPTMECLRRAALRTLRDEPEERCARAGLRELLDLSPLQVLLRVATLMAPALIGRFGDVLELF